MKFSLKTSIKQVHVIINPYSGSSKKKFPFLNFILGIRDKTKKPLTHKDIITKIKNQFSNTDIDIKFFLTENKSHATNLAKQAVTKNVDVVIAVGGDGTINEIINGISNTPVILAAIPFGTANIFCLEFNYTTKIENICKKVIKGNYTKIDLGVINGKYFACMAGIGFDAFVIKKADQYLKRIYGPLSYIAVAIKEYLNYPFNPIILTIDGQKETIKGVLVIVGNIKYYGGSLIIAPQADPKDGFLDVCVFKYHGIFNILNYGIKMKLGTLKNSNNVSYFRTKKLKINPIGNHSIHTDAEYYCKGPAYISIAEQALRIIS